MARCRTLWKRSGGPISTISTRWMVAWHCEQTRLFVCGRRRYGRRRGMDYAAVGENHGQVLPPGQSGIMRWNRMVMKRNHARRTILESSLCPRFGFGRR